MKMKKSLWHEKNNARDYHGYTKKFPMYRNESKELVKLADIKKGMTILDLACGTGVSTKEIIKKLGKSGKIYAVDFSEAMLNIAKKEIKNKNVIFIKSWAQKVDEIISEKVDRVICNGAFWIINNPETLEAIFNVMKDDGKLVFNMSGQVFKFDEKNTQKLILSSFSKIMTEIAVKEYGLDFNKFSNKSRMGNQDLKSLKNSIKDFFVIESFKISERKRSMEETYEFRKIPIMIKKFSEQLGYKKSIELLNKAYTLIDKKKNHNDKWIHFVAVKNKACAHESTQAFGV